MTSSEIVILTALISAIVTWLGFVYKKKRDDAESRKATVESDKILVDKDMSITKFYQEQVNDLTAKYKDLNERFELQEQESEDCEIRFRKLDIKYNELLIQVNLLKKNIKS